jgi:hypothetical protein
MGGGGTQTSTQTSGLSNPAMDAAATTIGNQLNSQLAGGVKPFTGSLAPALSSQTMAGVNALGNNPNNAAYGQGITNAIGQQAQIAAGNFGDDPTRARLIDDVSTNTNAILQGSGRFGSQSHENELIKQVGGNLAQYDYGRQQQAIANLPTLYQSSMLPAGAQLQAGQIMDAQALAKAQDAERLFDVTNNAGWNTLQRGSAIFSGTAPISGTTQSTTTPTAPWWQQALGYVAGNAGNAMRMM